MEATLRNFNETTITDAMIREFVRHPPGRAPDGRMVDGDYFHLDYDFS